MQSSVLLEIELWTCKHISEEWKVNLYLFSEECVHIYRLVAFSHAGMAVQNIVFSEEWKVNL